MRCRLLRVTCEAIHTTATIPTYYLGVAATKELRTYCSSLMAVVICTANTCIRCQWSTVGSGHDLFSENPHILTTLVETGLRRRNFLPSEPHLAVDRCPASTLTDRSCLSSGPSCFPNPATASMRCPRCHTRALEPQDADCVIDASNRSSIDATSSCCSTQGVGSIINPPLISGMDDGAHALTCNCVALL